MRIKIPEGAKTIIHTLTRAGYEAFVVGGCVRDSLLGIEPHDWDICTNAAPLSVKETLSGFRIIETGIKHGTVTVLIDGESYEVTTYRKDGDYSDHRRPDTVEFVSNLKEDLSRRDFTVNAMAYNDSEGLIDPFNGQDDLTKHMIRCVGNADHRFEEDALRVLRALRFASTYQFSIDPGTAAAIHRNTRSLEYVAQERIYTELCKLLVGAGALDILLSYSDVIAQIIPEMKSCVGFRQNNRYHCYTVYGHIAHSVAAYKGSDVTTKLALLLHDIGKPQCYSENETGGHFYDHARISRDLAKAVLDRFKVDNQTRHDVPELVLFHDADIKPTPRTVRKWLNRIGEVQLRRLLDVREADIAAHAPGTQEAHLKECLEERRVLEEVLAEASCFSLKDLKITGNDLMALGYKEGPQIGRTLRALLEAVMSDEIPNEHEQLMLMATKMQADGLQKGDR